MNQDEKKQAAARAAYERVAGRPIIGVGTGSTVNHFIDELAAIDHGIRGAVSSSEATSERLSAIGIELIGLEEAGTLAVYVDGADEADRARRLIKGGGGALTREKIIAAASEQFICVIDDSKLVDNLGAFPLPVEVIPLARTFVAAEIAELCGARVVLREGFTTDNGNLILDLYDLAIEDPLDLEERLNQITGVVANGLFCRRPAHLLLIAGDDGIVTIG